MEDAEQHVLQVNADLYNNYKLMANGMITEAITHELDSVSKTSIPQDADLHFKTLKKFVLDNDGVSVYNNNFVPIRDSYRLVSKKLSHVADLYNFLEATFIHKGSYDVFEEEILSETVEQVKENLAKKLRDSNIQVICTTHDQKWFVPRGVLLHVFYNLFTNSAYWIDKRKRWAFSDSHYQNENAFSEFIKVESAGADAFVVSDSGTGVIRAMEDVLFEALQSGKSYSERRGMGLYIVKQLLNSFGANIELLPDRNYVDSSGNTCVLKVNYGTRVVVCNEIINLCSFNQEGLCRIDCETELSENISALLQPYMLEYHSKLVAYFKQVKAVKTQFPDFYKTASELKIAKPLIDISNYQESGNLLDFGIKRVSRLKKTASLYLYKMFLEYRGRMPYTTINLTGYSLVTATIKDSEKGYPITVHIKLTSNRNKNRKEQEKLTWYIKRQELQETISTIVGEAFTLDIRDEYVELPGKSAVELSSGTSSVILKKHVEDKMYALKLEWRKPAEA